MPLPQSMEEQSIIEALSEKHFQRDDSQPWINQSYQAYESVKEFQKKVKIGLQDIKEFTQKYRLAHEWMGCVSPVCNTIMSIHYNLCIATIIRQGNGSPAIRGLLGDLVSFSSFGTFLGSELSFGSNLVSLQTTAEYMPSTDSFKLSSQGTGSKKFMPNTGHPRVPKIAVVLASLISGGIDCGIFPFVVKIRDKNGQLSEGVNVSLLGEKPGYPLDNAVTTLTNVVVDRDMALLGDSILHSDGTFVSRHISNRARFLETIDLINGGKICLVEGMARGSAISCKIAYQYATHKKSFAPRHSDIPLISYQNIRRAILTSLGRSITMDALNRKAIDLYLANLENSSAEKTLACNVSKYYASEETQRLTLLLREKIGSQGMFCNNKLIDYAVTMMGIVTAEGENDVLKLKTAKDLLHSSNLRDFLTVWPLKYDINTPSKCLNLIKADMNLAIRSIKVSLYIHRLKGMSFFDCYNNEVTRLIEIGRIYANHQAFSSALIGEGASKIDLAPETLNKIIHLTMLDYIRSRLSDMLAHGLIRAKVAKTMHSLENKLMSDLAPELQEVFQKLDAPNDALRVPLLDGSLEKAYAEL